MKEDNFINDIEYQKCMKILIFFEKYDLFEFNASLKEQLKRIDEYKIPERNKEDKIEIRIIDGYYPNSTNISKHLSDFFLYLNSISYVNKGVLSKQDVSIDKISSKEGYKNFYFDASRGQFVTQKVLNSETIGEASPMSM